MSLADETLLGAATVAYFHAVAENDVEGIIKYGREILALRDRAQRKRETNA